METARSEQLEDWRHHPNPTDPQEMKLALLALPVPWKIGKP